MPGDWHVILAPQLFTYVFSLDDNRNIRDYRSQPARIPWLDFLAILQAQYFHGYGESLLSYEQKSDILRAGLSLVR